MHSMWVQSPSTYTQYDCTDTAIHTILHQTEDSWHFILHPPKLSSSNSYVGICWTTPHPIHISEKTLWNDERVMYCQCFEYVECWRRAHTAHTKWPESCQADVIVLPETQKRTKGTMSPTPATSSLASRRSTSDSSSSSRCLPKIADLETLGSSTEQRGHNFPKFLKSIHHHAITNFKNSKDISKAILEFTDPYAELNKSKLSLIQIRKKGNLDLIPPATDETDADKFEQTTQIARKKQN